MWQNELNNEKDENGQPKYETIYLDAWENDYHTDPIIPLIGALNPYLELENANNADIKKAVIVIIKQLVKILTSFDVDSVLDDMGKQVETQSRNDFNIFNNLEEQKKTIKKELQKISEDKKVFFFIDELDRCKPLFSINLLERIKHFLDIPNFVFIFSMDMSQLNPSIKKVYGDIEVDKYFRKFFDLVFNLPTPKVDKYFKYLFESNELIGILQTSYIQSINKLVKINDNMALRECEKFFNIIRICHHKFNLYKYGDSTNYLISYMIFMKVLYPQEYNEFKSGKKDWDFNSIDKLILEKFDNNEISEGTRKHINSLFLLLGKNNYSDRVKYMNTLENGYEGWGKAIATGLSDFVNETLEFSELFK